MARFSLHRLAGFFLIAIGVASGGDHARAQSPDMFPDGREVVVLQEAYTLMEIGNFAAARERYAAIVERFTGTPAADIARHGATVAAILEWVNDADRTNSDATFIRIELNILNNSGTISRQERSFWRALVDADGDPETLAASGEYGIWSDEAFAQAVLERLATRQ